MPVPSLPPSGYSSRYLGGATDTVAIALHDSYADLYIDARGQSAPIFDGSWDWHSSVHAHLANVLAYQAADDMTGLAAFVAERFPPDLVQAEIDLTFDDPYGWAWLLQLDASLRESGFTALSPLADHLAERLRAHVEDRLAEGSAGARLGSHGDVNWMIANLALWAADRGDTPLAEDVAALSLAVAAQTDVSLTTDIATGDFFSVPAITVYTHVAAGTTQTADFIAAQEVMLSAVTDGSLDQLMADTAASLDAGIGFGHFAGRLISTAYGYWALFAEYQVPAAYVAYDTVVQFIETVADTLGDGIGPGHWLPNFAAFATALPSVMPVEDPDGTIAASIDAWIEGVNAGGVVLTGDFKDNLLLGTDGNDTLDGGRGEDILRGGAGDDQLLAGYDRGAGDTFDGGAGVDTYVIAGTEVDQFAFDLNLATGLDGYGNTYIDIENVIGGAAGDILTGDSGDNVLEGRGGDDWLEGGGGDDMLVGGSGVDRAVFNGTFDTFDFSYAGAELTVTGEGTDLVRNSVEILVFDDRELAWGDVFLIV